MNVDVTGPRLNEEIEDWLVIRVVIINECRKQYSRALDVMQFKRS